MVLSPLQTVIICGMVPSFLARVTSTSQLSTIMEMEGVRLPWELILLLILAEQ